MSERSSPIDVASKAVAYTVGSAYAVAAVLNTAKAGGAELHSTLPVIGQFINHIGNVAPGGVFALVAVAAVNRIDKKVSGLTTAQRVVGAGAIGLAIGAGFSAIADTQVGMDHIGKYLYNCENADPAEDSKYCTVDPADLAWGAVSSGVLAIGVSQLYKPGTANNYIPKHATYAAGKPPAAIEQVPDAATAVSLPLEQDVTHAFPLGK